MCPISKRQRLKLRKIPTTVYLDPPQALALRELSLRTHVPQQVYLRQGLDLVLRAIMEKAARSGSAPAPGPERSGTPHIDP